MFRELDESHPGKFPRPFLPVSDYTTNLPKWLRSYPDLFQVLWAIAAVIALYIAVTSWPDIHGQSKTPKDIERVTEQTYG